MLDDDDNLVTNDDQIKQMALKAYEDRLRTRPIKEGLEHILDAKEKLADSLMEKANLNKTPPWTSHVHGHVHVHVHVHRNSRLF